MSPALNGSSVLEHSEHSSVIEIRNRMMFDSTRDCHICTLWKRLNALHLKILNRSLQRFNPLTTNDTFWRCLTLAACYQLVQSVLKMGLALVEKVG